MVLRKRIGSRMLTIHFHLWSYSFCLHLKIGTYYRRYSKQLTVHKIRLILILAFAVLFLRYRSEQVQQRRGIWLSCTWRWLNRLQRLFRLGVFDLKITNYYLNESQKHLPAVPKIAGTSWRRRFAFFALGSADCQRVKMLRILWLNCWKAFWNTRRPCLQRSGALLRTAALHQMEA